ncbi:CoA-binding protein, partial [Brevundimonas sp. MYb27]
MMHVNDPAVVERLMRTKGTWAIVGLSTNQWRSAYDVSLYVRDKMGMEIIPVNLKGEDVHGEKGYKSLAEIPE